MGACVTIVPDTNVLLHSQPLDQIPWCDLTQSQSVEIVLVSQVLRELDAKKSGDSDKLRRRAQRVLSEIKRWIPSASSVGAVGNRTTIRVQVREPQPIDGLDLNIPDDRVIASALSLRGETPIVIASGDITMGYKAETHGIDVLSIPEQYRICDEEPRKKTVVSAPRPQLVASLFASDDALPSSNVEVRCGLTAGHLLPEAEQGLAVALGRQAEAARKRAAEEVARRATLSHSSSAVEMLLRPPSNILTDLHGIANRFDPTNTEPSVEGWEQYIASIKNYDERHPNTFALSVGLVNDGDAPAHDILVDFWFPEDVVVSDREPRVPSKPLRNRTLMLDSLLPRAYDAVEVNSSLRVDQHENGTRAHLKIKRLISTHGVAYAP